MQTKVLVLLLQKMEVRTYSFTIQKLKVAAVATLSDGQAVEYEVGQGQKGPCANNVVPA